MINEHGQSYEIRWRSREPLESSCRDSTASRWGLMFYLVSGRFTEEPPLFAPDGDDRECHENSQ
jgi:hypothetical protein